MLFLRSSAVLPRLAPASLGAPRTLRVRPPKAGRAQAWKSKAQAWKSKDQIDQNIFALHFGSAEIESDWVTYSFDKEKLQRCFKDSSPAASVFNWTLSIPPFAKRTITSVAVPSSASTHTDHVVATYAPEHAAAGMTVVHFFAKAEADAFERSLDR